MTGRTRRGFVAVVTAALGLLVVASCGVPTDAQPRDIEQPPAEVPREDVAAATTDNGPRVYFLITPEGQQNDMLAAVTRAVGTEPAVVLEQLFKGVSPEEATRLRTAIPNDTQLISSEVHPDGTLIVNVSDAFFKSTGDLQIKAVAQIVFTATELSGVQRVKIEVDGQNYPWPRGDGTLANDAVTQYDYPELDPTTQPDYPPLPSPTTSATTPTTIPA
jgi:spore germination protein GerM